MLPADLIDLIKSLGVFPVVLGTADTEGNVHLTFITWVYPINEKTLRIALSSGSKSAKNLQERGKACVMLFSPNKALTCYGNVRMVLERIEDVKFPVSVFELHIDKVEDNLFPGGTVTGIIPFAHTGNVEKMVELDSTVIEAMRRA
ncbi:MAG: pyridoxamine 5'-phosphate oxidase family protein [Hydrogenobacter sp.]